MEEDMSLSDFMLITTAEQSGENYLVKFGPEWVDELHSSTITISNCTSEFDAKERAFLFLKEKIESHKK